MRKSAFCVFGILCCAAFSAVKAQTQSSTKLERWAEEVTLGSEFGGDRDTCVRWVTAPSLSIFGASSTEKRLTSKSVKHLNNTLSKTNIGEIEVLNSNDETADILVYFAQSNKLHGIAKKHGFDYVEGSEGFFWAFWKNYQIDRAFVLIASDKLKGKRLRHVILEEITQTLGLMNDSLIFPGSIFYDRWSDRQYLSRLDKKLIVFFYNHIQPGATRQDVRIAFGEHWPSG